MSIFTIMTYAMLALVVASGLVALLSDSGARPARRWLARRGSPVADRRALRPRA